MLYYWTHGRAEAAAVGDVYGFDRGECYLT